MCQFQRFWRKCNNIVSVFYYVAFVFPWNRAYIYYGGEYFPRSLLNLNFVFLSPFRKRNCHFSEQTWILSTEKCFMLGFEIFYDAFYLFLEEGLAIHVKKTLIFFTQVLWNWPSNYKTENVYDNDNKDNDHKYKTNLNHLRLQLRWAKRITYHMAEWLKWRTIQNWAMFGRLTVVFII